MSIAAIFDMDGPLLRLSDNENQSYINAITEMYGDCRISTLWDEYPIRTDTEITKHIIKNLTGCDATQEEIRKFCANYARNLKKKLQEGNGAVATPGVVSLLQNLSKRLKLGVATGNFREVASVRLHSAGLWRFFEKHCEGSGDGGSKTEILTRLINGFPKKITRVFFIGDSISDMVAAKYCGAEFIGFSESKTRRKDLSMAGCKFVAASHAQTEEFILEKLVRFSSY